MGIAFMQIAGVETATSASVQTRSHIFDRTVSCRVEGEGAPGPARYITASAFPRRGKGQGQVPFVYVHHSEGEGGFSIGFAISPQGRAWVNRSLCTATGLRVELSSRELQGGRTPFGEQQRCDVPARILIRIRAVFTRPVAFRTDPRARYQRHAPGRIVSGSLAVATLERKPIAFATADDASGRAAIFASPSRCFPT
jgi:hypothetical protein